MAADFDIDQLMNIIGGKRDNQFASDQSIHQLIDAVQGHQIRSRTADNERDNSTRALAKEMKSGGGMFSKMKFDAGKFDTNMAGLAATFGLAGGTFGLMMGHADKLADSYRLMLDHGQRFDGKLLDMSEAAYRSGLSLDELAGLVATKSEMINRVGALEFGEMQLALRQALAPMNGLGFKSAELTEQMAEYMDIQRLYGKAETLTTQQATASMQQLMTETTALAALTGKDRKKMLQEAMDRTKGQADVQLVLSTMSQQARDNYQKMQTEISAIGGPAAGLVDQLLKTKVAMGNIGHAGPEVLGAFKMFGPAGEEVINMINDAGGNLANVSDEQRGMILEKIKKLTENMTPEMAQKIAIGANKGIGPFQNALEAASGSLQTANVSIDDFRKALENVGKYANETRGPLAMEETLKQAKTTMQNFGNELTQIVAREKTINAMLGGVAGGMEKFNASDPFGKMNMVFGNQGEKMLRALADMNLDEGTDVIGALKEKIPGLEKSFDALGKGAEPLISLLKKGVDEVGVGGMLAGAVGTAYAGKMVYDSSTKEDGFLNKLGNKFLSLLPGSDDPTSQGWDGSVRADAANIQAGTAVINSQGQSERQSYRRERDEESRESETGSSNDEMAQVLREMRETLDRAAAQSATNSRDINTLVGSVRQLVTVLQQRL